MIQSSKLCGSFSLYLIEAVVKAQRAEVADPRIRRFPGVHVDKMKILEIFMSNFRATVEGVEKQWLVKCREAGVFVHEVTAMVVRKADRKVEVMRFVPDQASINRLPRDVVVYFAIKLLREGARYLRSYLTLNFGVVAEENIDKVNTLMRQLGQIAERHERNGVTYEVDLDSVMVKFEVNITKEKLKEQNTMSIMRDETQMAKRVRLSNQS